MVQLMKKAKASISRKTEAVKNTAAGLAFRSRHILSQNVGDGYIDTASASVRA